MISQQKNIDVSLFNKHSAMYKYVKKIVIIILFISWNKNIMKCESLTCTMERQQSNLFIFLFLNFDNIGRKYDQVVPLKNKYLSALNFSILCKKKKKISKCFCDLT